MTLSVFQQFALLLLAAAALGLVASWLKQPLILAYIVMGVAAGPALVGWAAPAYRLKGREGWIGWNETQRRSRLHLVATNARFCLLGEPGRHPNLASHVLARNLERLSQDWQEAYGHPILVVESFVDRSFRGTSYKATGWKALGCTAGFKRVAEDFYVLHDQPKQLFVRELVKHAARKLRARQMPADLGTEAPEQVRPPVQIAEGVSAYA